jgi:DNA polymerase I
LVSYITEQQELEEACRNLSSLPILGVDTETTGIDLFTNDILLISVGYLRDQYVFDVAKLGNKLELLKNILESKPVILHNAKFDYKFIKYKLGITLENIWDTMIAEMLLLKGLKKTGYGLDDVVEKYSGQVLDKDIRKSFIKMKPGDIFTENQIRYSAEDVQFLETVQKKQKETIHSNGMDRVSEIEMGVIPATSDMELNGIFLNREMWKKTIDVATLTCKDAQIKLDEFFIPIVGPGLFGAAINYNSPKQLLPVLKTILGDKGKGLKATDDDAIKVIDHPVIKALQEYRKASKQISTYGNSFLENINAITGRIHSDFNQMYTDTGRYSSSGPNLQNIPKLQIYRSAFTGFSEDYRIVGCDYSGMELRILADLSKEPFWLEVFGRKGDLHAEIGTMLTGRIIRKPETLGPDDPGENYELRGPVKSLNFGVGYGMGPMKLARETGMPLNEARALVKAFWNKFTKIKEFFDEYTERCIKNKCAVSPYDGRVRYIEGVDLTNPREKAGVRNMTMNFPMQSGNASITKLAMTRIRNNTKNKDMKLVCTIHDEILVEAHKDVANECLEIVRRDMISSAGEYIKNVSVEVEGGVNTCWTK